MREIHSMILVEYQENLNISPPDGRLTIVYEYFTHGFRDYFSVDSYPTGTGVTDIDYSEIPLYLFRELIQIQYHLLVNMDLSRCSRFHRPRIGDYDFSTYSTANTVLPGTLKSISPFSFAYRDFTSTTASLTDVPKSDDTFYPHLITTYLKMVHCI